MPPRPLAVTQAPVRATPSAPRITPVIALRADVGRAPAVVAALAATKLGRVSRPDAAACRAAAAQPAVWLRPGPAEAADAAAAVSAGRLRVAERAGLAVAALAVAGTAAATEDRTPITARARDSPRRFITR